MRDKPDSCYEGCPLAETGRGFCLDSGDAATAKMLVCCEAPGADEITFPLTKQEDTFWAAEIERRRAAYPDLPERLIKIGAPVVGRSGSLYWHWMMSPVGQTRRDVFQMNVLRCKPPKHGDSNYPIGETRKQAERHCRQYDRHAAFAPDTAVVTIHPAALVRDITPLPLVVEDVRKARDLAKEGRRVMLLAGGKAAKAFTGGRENPTYWRGDIVAITGSLVE